MLKPCYFVGFTGHRTGFDEAAAGTAIRKALRDVQARADRLGGRAELCTSVAEGADTLCVEIARELDMPVHLLVPLAEADFEADFTSPASWRRSEAQLEFARQRPGRDSVCQVPGGAPRPACYFDQAIYMLDSADVLIALWNGEAAQGLGGTEQVVAQAKATGIPVIHIDPASGKTAILGDLDAPFRPDPILTELNRIAAAEAPGCAADAATPDGLQTCLDTIAMREAGRFRPSLVRIIFFHGLAALLAAIVTFKAADLPVWEDLKWTVTLLELLLVSSALWMTFRLHRQHTQHLWIRCRMACEVVRGLRASVPLLDPLHPAVAHHDPAWRRFALSAGLLVLAHQPTADAEGNLY